MHAAVRVEASDRRRMEQLCLCRYITRPALSDERVQLNAAGQVELELETPWRDGLAGRAGPEARPLARHEQSSGLFVSGLGTTHLVMSPLEFMQRLAALVPRPRLHLIRLHGVPAPNVKLRALVVPQGPEKEEQATEAAAAAQGPSARGRARLKPLEPRRPSKTPRCRLQRQTAAGAASRDASARRHRNQGQPRGRGHQRAL
ncbi:MAG TPA: transposase [Rubrivivax sp.]|nr:transposase [Rubrivivax sp.]